MRHRRLLFEHLETRTVLSGAGWVDAAAELCWPEPAVQEQIAGASSLALSTLNQAVVSPSAWEQYLLELINRGRWDPPAEAARYGVALNEDLPPGTISSQPKQPLAFSPALIQAAREHSQWMLDTDTFSHTGAGNSTPSQRMSAAGYQLHPPWSVAENIAYQASSGTINKTATTANLHAGLYRSEGHRRNQMNDVYREVGLGAVEGLYTDSVRTWNALFITENFASSGSAVFLTGVVYKDGQVLADDFYTPGEGLGSVAIQAVRQGDGQVFSTHTWESGGYTLALPRGTYVVTAAGALLGGAVGPRVAAVDAHNVKLDFTAADNLIPLVSLLTIDPSPALRSAELHLTVNAQDPDGDLVQVEFYRGADLLGIDSDGSDGWSWIGSTAGWSLGEQALSARVQDDRGAWSVPVSASVLLYGELPPIVFGPLPVFSLGQRTFTFQNSGAGSVSIDRSAVTAPFSIHSAQGSGGDDDWIVAPGATKAYTLAYAPGTVGGHQGSLRLTSTAAEGPWLARITGSGVSVWQHAPAPHDINTDGLASALDVLLLINEINRHGSRELSQADAQGSLLVDVDGDGSLSPADVLAVINHINWDGSRD